MSKYASHRIEVDDNEDAAAKDTPSEHLMLKLDFRQPNFIFCMKMKPRALSNMRICALRFMLSKAPFRQKSQQCIAWYGKILTGTDKRYTM